MSLMILPLIIPNYCSLLGSVLEQLVDILSRIPYSGLNVATALDC